MFLFILRYGHGISGVPYMGRFWMILTNKMTHFGGPAQNKTRFPAEIVKGHIQWFHLTFEGVSMRLCDCIFLVQYPWVFLKWSYDTVDGCEIPHQLVGGCLSRYSRYNPTKFTNLQCFIATNSYQLLRDATIHSIPAAEVYPSCSSLDPAEMQRISSLSRQKKKTSLEAPDPVKNK